MFTMLQNLFTDFLTLLSNEVLTEIFLYSFQGWLQFDDDKLRKESLRDQYEYQKVCIMILNST